MAGAACEHDLERRFGRQACAVRRESETAHTAHAMRESCRDLDRQALDAIELSCHDDPDPPQSQGATLAWQASQSAAVAEAKQWAAAARQRD